MKEWTAARPAALRSGCLIQQLVETSCCLAILSPLDLKATRHTRLYILSLLPTNGLRTVTQSQINGAWTKQTLRVEGLVDKSNAI